MMLKAPNQRSADCVAGSWRRSHFVLAAAVVPVLAVLQPVRADDNSPAPILQWFDGSYHSIESRMGDVFKAGYGMIYTAPPGRADSGNQSVGYDQYDRFDLGSPGNPTLYGTETGLRKAVVETHKAGLNYAVDLVLNHAGFSDLGTPGFYEAGGYPGLNISLPYDVDGDFNGGFEWGDINGRLAGLIDIDHAKNYQMIRSPVDPNDPRNIRPGTTPRFGRLANVADPNNARFYPDLQGPSISVFDPKTGESDIRIYNFNNANPLAGDAVPENVTGYLMRNTQWLAQSIGIDAFRLDAAKHMQGFALDYYDRSVYRQSQRRLLDGSQPNIFSWSEVFDGNKDYLQTFVRKDINPSDPGRVGGNRDTMDFPLFFAMEGNLSSNGMQNDWRNITGASLDLHDDGKMNGSQGVKFVQSHDSHAPALANTAHAMTLMLPGNSIVYYNAKEFGTGRDFPKDGRGDALGGAYGDTITKLVNIRNVYAQGNYKERWLEQNQYAFERSNQSVTLLSNRTDDGFDSRTLNVDFAWGEHLVELTGNAARYNSWHPDGEKVPEVVTVFNDYFDGPSKINVRFLRGNNSDMGYLVYGLQAPQGSLALSNVAQTLAGGSTTLTGSSDEKAWQNATRRLTDLKVINGDSFGVTLNTSAVNLLGSIRDRNADGDNAMLKLDEGLDLNNNGRVDYVTPGSAAYGFEEFRGTHSPGYFNSDGNGTYTQSVDASRLSEGYHYLTVRAFRHRPNGGPAVYQDFKEVLYVDRLKPISSVNAYKRWDGAAPGEHDLWLKSDDGTADSMHVFLNLPAGLTEAEIMAKVQNGEGLSQKIDRDIFKMYFGGSQAFGSGNNALTLVTFEITGTSNVQRFTGIAPASVRGGGFGDTNFNGVIDAFDMTGTSHGVEHYLYAGDRDFNPAVDLNGDGLIDTRDVLALDKLTHITGSGKDALRQVVLRRGNINGEFGTDQWDIDSLFALRGTTGTTGAAWTADLNVDGIVDDADVSAMVLDVLQTRFGDVNLDSRIDLADLQIMADNWKQGDKGWALADITGDRFVDDQDFNLLATSWNFGVPSGQGISLSEAMAVTGIPEPTAAVTLLGAGSALMLRRRRPNMKA